MAEHPVACDSTGKQCLSRSLAAKRARNARRLRGERVGAYICRECGWWHIGHTPSGVPVRRRKRHG